VQRERGREGWGLGGVVVVVRRKKKMLPSTDMVYTQWGIPALTLMTESGAIHEGYVCVLVAPAIFFFLMLNVNIFL